MDPIYSKEKSPLFIYSQSKAPNSSKTKTLEDKQMLLWLDTIFDVQRLHGFSSKNSLTLNNSVCVVQHKPSF